MQVSDEIIKVLEYLGEKLGVKLRQIDPETLMVL